MKIKHESDFNSQTIQKMKTEHLIVPMYLPPAASLKENHWNTFLFPFFFFFFFFFWLHPQHAEVPRPGTETMP